MEKVRDPCVKRMTQNLADMLVEMMPELKDVGAWHSVGQRRTLDEMGRIVECAYSSLWHGLPTMPQQRSALGTRLVEKTPCGRWETTTFLGALRAEGFIAPLTVEGAINGALFRAWVEQHLAPVLKPGDIDA